MPVRQRVGGVVGDHKTVARQCNRRREQIRKLEFSGAIFFQRQCKSRDGAGHADPERLIARLPGVRFAVVTQKHVARGSSRCALAIVDGDIFVAARQMNHHEAAAADIARTRIGDGHGEAGGDSGIDRVAAARQNIAADPCRDTLLCDDHAVLRGNRPNDIERRRIVAMPRILREHRQRVRQPDDAKSKGERAALGKQGHKLLRQTASSVVVRKSALILRRVSMRTCEPKPHYN